MVQFVQTNSYIKQVGIAYVVWNLSFFASRFFYSLPLRQGSSWCPVSSVPSRPQPTWATCDRDWVHEMSIIWFDPLVGGSFGQLKNRIGPCLYHHPKFRMKHESYATQTTNQSSIGVIWSHKPLSLNPPLGSLTGGSIHGTSTTRIWARCNLEAHMDNHPLSWLVKTRRWQLAKEECVFVKVKDYKP